MSDSKACPVCGSNKVVRVPSSQTISVSGDRKCESCGTQWAPRVPKWAAGVILAICLPLLAGDLVYIVFALISVRIGFAFFCGLALVFLLGAGSASAFRILSGKGGQMQIVSRGNARETEGLDVRKKQ